MLFYEKILNKKQLQIKVAQSFEGLDFHAESWNQLAFESPEQLPMSTIAWVSSYFEYYNETIKLLE